MAQSALLNSKEQIVKANALSVLGRLSHSKSDFGSALESFEEAAKLDPDCEAIQFSLAQAYISKGNIEAACSSLEKILKAKPFDYDTNKVRYVSFSCCFHCTRIRLKINQKH
jgi:tetratricopeptide (TPR) repeat protein